MLEDVDATMAGRLTPDVIAGIVELIPDAWLADGTPDGDGGSYRAAYRATCWTVWRRRAPSSRRPFMRAEHTYDYAIIRVVPRVERGELINVGVILSCPDAAFLEARIEFDPARLLALDPTLDVEATRANLETIPAGVPRAAGRRARLASCRSESRFHWLVSPRSTIIQFSPVHTGRTDDPEAAMERLLETMVRHGNRL